MDIFWRYLGIAADLLSIATFVLALFINHKIQSAVSKASLRQDFHEITKKLKKIRKDIEGGKIRDKQAANAVHGRLGQIQASYELPQAKFDKLIELIYEIPKSELNEDCVRQSIKLLNQILADVKKGATL